jgi:hypothetical protein
LKLKVIACMSMLFGATVVSAGPITYNVDRTVAQGSVTGTIETDGTTGVDLTVGDIVDWNLELNDGQGNTFNLTGPLSGNDSSVFIGDGDVTASPSDLFFNFSGTDNGYLLFEVSFGSGMHYYCDSADSQGLCLAGESVVPATLSTIQNVTLSGNQIIGTASGTSTVPEPKTYGLTLIGFGLLVLMRKHIVPSPR